jgi:hypothetical protein
MLGLLQAGIACADSLFSAFVGSKIFNEAKRLLVRGKAQILFYLAHSFRFPWRWPLISLSSIGPILAEKEYCF